MSDRVEHVDGLRARPTDELVDAYAQLDALENAIRAERLAVLGVLDERDVARADGAINTSDWVALMSRVRRSTGRVCVDVARRLRDLPAIAQAAAEGRLSFDQLAPVTKIATPETDDQWARDAVGMSAAALDALARGRREVSTDEAAERQRQRSLRWWHDPRTGMTRLVGRLPDLDGETVTTALGRLADRLARQPGGNKEPWDALRADALVELASTELATDIDGDRACVILHIPATGASTTGVNDTPVATETARRVACDATLQVLIKDAVGNPVGLSPKRRTVLTRADARPAPPRPTLPLPRL